MPGKASRSNNLWYHGSPLKFRMLRAGSTVTPFKKIAEVFSHDPSLVVREELENSVRWLHNGDVAKGYLYEVHVENAENDLEPHPESTMRRGEEWITRRTLGVRLLTMTYLNTANRLTAEDIDAL